MLKRHQEGEDWARRLLQADPANALNWNATTGTIPALKATVENPDPNILPPGFKSSPVVTEKLVMLGDEEGTFHAVDRATGKLEFTGQYAPVGNPSSLVFLDLAKAKAELEIMIAQRLVACDLESPVTEASLICRRRAGETDPALRKILRAAK